MTRHPPADEAGRDAHVYYPHNRTRSTRRRECGVPRRGVCRG